MTVSIDVDVNTRSANIKLGNLKAQLEALDDDLDLELDLDGDLDGIFDNLSDTVDNLTEAFDDFDSNLDDKISRLEDLDLNASVSTGDGDSGGDTGSDSGDEEAFKRVFGRINNKTRQNTIDDILSGDAGEAFDGGDSDGEEDSTSFRQLLRRAFVAGSNGEYDFAGKKASERRFDLSGIAGDDLDLSLEEIDETPDRTTARLNDRLAFRIREAVSESDSDSSSIRKALNDAFGDGFRFDYDPDISSERRMRGDTEFGKSTLRQHLLRMGIGDHGIDMDSPGFSAPRTRRGKALYDMSHLDGIVGRSGSVANLDGLDGSRSRGQRLIGVMEGIGDTTQKLKRKFRKLIPSMSTWLNLIGAAVPALGALAVQALGVASAMGAIAFAGAGMIGLGLLGHGDSLASSMKGAKEEVQDLKLALFEAIEPTADIFGGIQAEFFDFIPAKIGNIARSMQGLTTLKSEVFEMFSQLTKFVSQFIVAIVDNEQVISELWDSFQGIIGTSIINLFEFLLVAAQKNQDELKKLGSMFKDLAIALYQVFVAISTALTILAPFIKALTHIGSYLNNILVSGMIAIVIAAYALTTAFTMVGGALGMIATILGTGLIPLFSAMFVKISTYIFQTLAATAVTYGWAAAIANAAAALGTLLAMSGIGLLIGGVGLAAGKSMGFLDPGGSSRSSGGSSYRGSGAGTTIVNEGDNVNLEVGSMSRTDAETVQDWENSGGRQESVDGSFTV